MSPLLNRSIGIHFRSGTLTQSLGYSFTGVSIPFPAGLRSFIRSMTSLRRTTSVTNPMLPAERQHATRDIVSELTAAVGKQGLRMGLYYSGGYDWTFVPGPIRVAADYETVKPQ